MTSEKTRIHQFKYSSHRKVQAPAPTVFGLIRRIGGRNGWYYLNWVWQVRGWLDRLVGGVGMRDGRRNPEQACVGDIVDFWRVEALEPDRFLKLRAEMRLPGQAWLQFEVLPESSDSVIRQTAIFDAEGWAGLAYWYGLDVIHRIVFAGMLRRIAHAAEADTPRKS